MDPFIMKTVGEEWARDRRQRHHECERETGSSGQKIGNRSVAQYLHAQLRKHARLPGTRDMPEREPTYPEASATY
jgi:hypothetical protein